MLDLLYKRRSIRKYASAKLEVDTVQLLIGAALLSPSSRGFQPRQFVAVDDPEVLTQLASCKKGAGFLKDAALGIVILADPAKSDVWIEDASIAATILHLTSASLGLGSCWIQIRERQFSESETAEQYVRRILSIPENLKVSSIISIGYPGESKSPHVEGDLGFNKVHVNKYGSKF
ncbi:nitroreductase family protein [Desulfosporosinus sp.]|uniref:nitroreductase family protein n=1 Tax=Desulfosporosinus sp. TaxID=157907 RepID=UPI0023135C61|nr:nitroreductase family protein [Desulfosporosinus sp.]MCO5388703.1 nitroreductase family protein [Desulfosporosinus sp.]MDA8221887.1 nitroreductase family protein [Desulfitobacterium hafniense]